MVDDALGLSEEEVVKRKDVSAQLLLQLHNRISLLAQKAKLKWLKERDVNSKVFHKAIKSRRSRNGIRGLEVGGEWVEDPSRIKETVKDHFRLQFQKKRFSCNGPSL